MFFASLGAFGTAVVFITGIGGGVSGLVSLGADFGQGVFGWFVFCAPCVAYLLFRGRASEVRKVVWRLAPVAVFYAVYVALVHWTQRPSVVLVAYRNALGVDRLERILHVAWEGRLSRLPLPGATLYYDWAQVFVVVGVLCWCVMSPSDEFWRLRRNALALIAGGGFLVYWLVPVAPPWVLPASFGIHSAGLGSLAGVGDLMGAMPSLHTAWAGWVAVVLWYVGGWWRVAGVVNLVLTAVVVVCTGNHFVLDVVAGELLAYTACYVAPVGSDLRVRLLPRQLARVLG